MRDGMILLKMIFLCLCLVPSMALAKVYKAPFDHAKWKLATSKTECTMSHVIPEYGVATFQTKAGQKQTFTLETTISQFTAKKATIIDTPPKWKTTLSQMKKPKKLASVAIKNKSKPVHLTKLTSYEMLSALAEGREPYIEIQMAQKDHTDKVVLSATGFKKPYNNYLKCIDGLVDYAFETVKKSTLFFNSGSLALPSESKAKLDAIIAYVENDENVYRIDLTGHSDSKGSYLANRKLANQRMWAVKDYLVMEGGIHPDLFTLKGYSDRMPLASNKTEEGRAKNRRVELKIYR